MYTTYSSVQHMIIIPYVYDIQLSSTYDYHSLCIRHQLSSTWLSCIRHTAQFNIWLSFLMYMTYSSVQHMIIIPYVYDIQLSSTYDYHSLCIWHTAQFNIWLSFLMYTTYSSVQHMIIIPYVYDIQLSSTYIPYVYDIQLSSTYDYHSLCIRHTAQFNIWYHSLICQQLSSTYDYPL